MKLGPGYIITLFLGNIPNFNFYDFLHKFSMVNNEKSLQNTNSGHYK